MPSTGALALSTRMWMSLESELGDVDAVVVTAITYFDEVEEQLGRKLDCPVVSLENILYEM